MRLWEAGKHSPPFKPGCSLKLNLEGHSPDIHGWVFVIWIEGVLSKHYGLLMDFCLSPFNSAFTSVSACTLPELDL